MFTSNETLSFTVNSPDELGHVAEQILEFGPRVIFLQGDLGAGKTTLVKAMCMVLGSADEVTSPTFTLVNEYRDAQNLPIFHIDLYRLDTLDDALQIGIEDYLNSDSWCFIEWPELIRTLPLSEKPLDVYLEANPDESRRILILK